MPKPDSDQRRFILDLSKPAGFSVNDGISKDFYLGQPVTLRYPTVTLMILQNASFSSGPVACYTNTISNLSGAHQRLTQMKKTTLKLQSAYGLASLFTLLGNIKTKSHEIKHNHEKNELR